ncbi:MAG TPA: Gfo/Idh/MocA family oxidoreductase [Candidatus Micrarchaeaceae archaeon]|nr:Gfo/Idh/MocA family oxidoreductase [Candidatus Micrarchaeaceae archaeon]
MKARIGIIGCGWWSTEAHIPALLANPDAELCAVADPNEQNLSRAAKAFDIPTSRLFGDCVTMLDNVDLDAAIVAVPHSQHASMARLVLENDLHLLLEKPMTINPSDARALAQLARVRNRELIVGYPWHFDEQVLAVRDAIASGLIGTIESAACQSATVGRDLYRGDARSFGADAGFAMVNLPLPGTYADPKTAGGGQGQTQVTHSAALLFYMTGLRPVKVGALTGSFGLAVDLADSVLIMFSNGAIGSLTSTGTVLRGHKETLRYQIFGTEGHVFFEADAGTATIHLHGGELRTVAKVTERHPEWLPANNLVDVTLGRAANGSPASIGVLTVEFVDALYRSARAGRLVDVSN